MFDLINKKKKEYSFGFCKARVLLHPWTWWDVWSHVRNTQRHTLFHKKIFLYSTASTSWFALLRAVRLPGLPSVSREEPLSTKGNTLRACFFMLLLLLIWIYVIFVFERMSISTYLFWAVQQFYRAHFLEYCNKWTLWECALLYGRSCFRCFYTCFILVFASFLIKTCFAVP